MVEQACLPIGTREKKGGFLYLLPAFNGKVFRLSSDLETGVVRPSGSKKIIFRARNRFYVKDKRRGHKRLSNWILS